MKSFALSAVLIGLLISTTAQARSSVATANHKKGTPVAIGAPQAGGSRAKRSVSTKAASFTSARQSEVSNGVRNVPSECASCPVAATCYPA